ncbi:MAG: biotin--[acetyl-CoA-carboxylase] ligase, partial [Gammaproteobacteria bacterium]|nr:biotin--[acetyl-CoA-carboxylase] ligase [Gammaproteobacteria bacterium]
MKISQELQARWPNWTIEWFEEIDSTNSYLMRHCKLGEKRICIAGAQTMGRGRRGKDWATPKGNLAISLAFEYEEISRISQLAPRVGAEIARAFSPLISDVQVKWPNDV